MKPKTAKNTAQQGDVNFRRLSELPKGEIKIIQRKRCVVAEGEHTGHSHVIEDDEAELIQVGEMILLKLEKSATIQHQEHKPITLEKGIWQVGRVQEYDWFQQMQRQVMD
jgi:hypothetical protein